MRKLLILTGKSGSGKSSVRDVLLKEYGYHVIKTVTTRPVRDGETQGVDYDFISYDEYDKMDKSRELINMRCYFTDEGRWYYGTHVKELEDLPERSVIILTPDGVEEIIEYLKSSDVQIQVVYLYANNNTMRIRLKDRGDKMEEIARRIEADNEDFKGVENIFNCKIVYNNIGAKVEDVAARVNEVVG